MTKFRFVITTEATMSAVVEVEAATIEEAQRTALTPEFYRDSQKVRWEPDQENDVGEVYLPDQDAFEEIGGA